MPGHSVYICAMRGLTLLLAWWIATVSALPDVAAWPMRPAAPACTAADCCHQPTDPAHTPLRPKKCTDCPIGVCNPLHSCVCCAVVLPPMADAAVPTAKWPAARALPLPPTGQLAVIGFGSGWWQPPERLG